MYSICIADSEIEWLQMNFKEKIKIPSVEISNQIIIIKENNFFI